VLPSRSFLEAHSKRSLERSRARRGAAEAARREARRRRFTRLPAPTVALVLALSVAGVGGLGAATAHFGQQGSASSSGVLTVGSRGPTVAALQNALGVGATGYYGSVTRRAVLTFQRSRGLLVDGVAGPQTLGALGLSASPDRAGASGDSASGSGSGAASGATQSGATANAQASASSASLHSIATCESGGNPGAVGGGGRYRGKYQFTIDTWRAYGGTGDPASAPEALQDAIAAKVLAAQGASAWPSCAR
jgi:hypothetical protein